MDSLLFNKVAGAVLGTIFLMFGGSLVAEGIFHSEEPETPGYEIVVAESSSGEGGGEEVAEVEPIAVRLQNADAEAGATDFRKCAACHSPDPSGENKIGPGLWAVVDRPIASHEGFSYSAAMTDFSEGGSVVWDYEHLDHFLENPKGYIDGTAMGFAGIRDPQDRADTIAYLRSLSDSPAPLPEPPAEGEATAEGEQAAEGGEEVADNEGGDEASSAEEQPGATTQPQPSDQQINTQSPGTTDPDTGSAMPGQAQAGVLSEENQPETRANEIQEQDAPQPPAADTAGSSDAEGAASSQPEGSESGEAPAESDDQAAAAGGAMQIAGDASAGESVFRRCQACHAVGDGATNKIGPELNGILGERIASVEGYTFSQALQDYAAEHPTWNVENLTAWLMDPRGTVPGTKMSFAGLKDQEDIDNVIAYLAQFGEDGSTSGN